MDEHKDTSPRPPVHAPEEAPGRRELLLMHRAGRAFAVYGEEADAAVEGRRPAPLPNAPRAVLGVVPVRGRMRTVIDPAAIAEPTAEEEEEATTRDAATPAFVVTLRGDEQLALACERAERVEAAPAPDAGGDPPAPHVRATFSLGPLRVTLLDPSRLFEAAMRGTERRRHRLKKP